MCSGASMIRVFYREENKIPIIYTFKRRDGKLVINKDKFFRPYFFVRKEEAKIMEGIIGIDGKKFTSIFGDEVKRLFCLLPQDVKSVRQYFTQTFEADVHFTYRWFIDKFSEDRTIINSDKAKVLYIDIEVDDREGFPNYENPKQKILSIQFSINLGKVTILLLRPDNEDFNSVNYLFISDDLEVKIFDKEKDLLNYFFNHIMNDDWVDIITGWNVSFDTNYLIARSIEVGAEYTKLSPIGVVSIQEIVGCDIVDMLEWYKFIKQKSLKSYSLDMVASEELGKGKLYHLGGKMYFTWQKDTKVFTEYAYDDILYLKELEKKVGIINFIEEYANLGFLFQMFEYKSIVVDTIFLIEARKRGLVLPSKAKVQEELKFQGAKVLDPPAGVFDNVVNFDVQRMYPSIIQQFNLSPECLTDEKNKNALKLDIELFTEREEKINRTIYLDTSKKSLISEVFNILIGMRMEYQKEMKTIMKTMGVSSREYKIVYDKQYAVKILINSIYGVLGLKTFRLYKPELASATTMIGRKILLSLKDLVEKNLNLKVLYGDTDSIFIQFAEKKSITELKETEKQINTMITKLLVDEFKFKEANIKVEIDKVFISIFFYAKKKRYVGFKEWEKDYIKDCGKCFYCDEFKICKDRLELKGFEAKRSNVPTFMEHIQKDVLYLILLGKTKEEVKKYIYNFLEEEANLMNYSPEEIATPISLTKKVSEYKVNTPHVRGVKWAEKLLNVSFLPGDKIYYIWLKGYDNNPDVDVMAFKSEIWLDLNKLHIDWDRLFDLVTKNLSNLFEELGWGMNLIYRKNNILKWLK